MEKEKEVKRLNEIIRKLGTRFPKKHGEWYRLPVFDNNVLILDTWNGSVYHHIGGESTGTDNMYNVVYAFSGMQGSVKSNMINFWIGHLTPCGF